MRIDESALDQRLETLERVRSWSPRLVSKLEALLRAADDRALFRINPYAFAAERGVAEPEAIELFLHGTKAGLFNMEWHAVCPSCTDMVETFAHLGELRATYHCDLCRTDLATALDDLIAVSFTVRPTVRGIAFHEPESLPIERYAFEYHFALRPLDAGGTPVGVHMQPYLKTLAWIDPGATETFERVLEPGIYTGSDRVHRAEFRFTVDESPATGPQRLAMRLEGGRFTPDGGTLHAGPVTIEVTNASDRRAALLGVSFGPGRPPPKRLLPRFLSGKQLFVTQTFRDLFRAETVAGQSGLALEDLSFVFTDLKGSTELYDRIGDVAAFHLVEQHFASLLGVVRAHGGAVVKTIGDAVMASFATPRDAVAGALAMLREMRRFNRERSTDGLSLKVGVHHGPCIAVTLNDRLDYFGQTINVAARVQGLAGAGEICLSADVAAAPGVAELVADHEVTEHEARVKGIQRALRVQRVKPRTIAPPAV